MSIAEEEVDVEARRSDVHRAPAAPRITVPPEQHYPWYVRVILALQRRKYGAEFESARVWGLLPRSFLMLSMLYRTLDRAGSPIEAGLRALVQVRISQINWCAFCIDANGAVALERSVAPEKLAALGAFEESPLYSDAEKAALAYAEAMTDSARGVDDALFARLRRHFGEREILELTALAAFQNLSSKFNAALGVPAQGFCAQGSAAPARGSK
jgi:AhpD family alkylhydroperoxidase